MKNFLISLFFACIFAPVVLAEEPVPSNVTLQLLPGEPNEEEVTIFDQAKTWLEIGAYFNQNYPDAFIEEDLSADVRRFFPDLTPQEVYDREQTIRNGVKFYRYFKDVYEKVKSKFLVPEAPPLMVDEKDYDDYVPEPYVEAGEGQVLITTDFKKVLSYGADKRDYEAYKARLERQRKKDEVPHSGIGKLSNILSSLEWRKLPFYGIFYENPVIGSRGGGDWVSDKTDSAVKASLLAETTAVNGNKDIRGVLRVYVPEGYEIRAVADDKYSKPEVDFGASENLSEAVIFRPVPQRLRREDGNDRIVFLEKMVIPVIYKPQDVDKPLHLKAKISFVFCDDKQNCRQTVLEPELSLEPGNGYPSAFNNFIIQNFNYLPLAESDDLTVDKVIADDDEHSLRIIMTNKGIAAKPDIFVSTNDNIRFSRPRIAIDGDRMIARLDVLDKNVKLAEREIELTVVLDEYTALRNRYEVSAASVLDFMGDKLSLGMILLAVLGGFILNFMPCVFPVLSLKLLSVTGFGAQRESAVKKSFLLTVAGIFGAFVLLAILLAGIKALGHSVGWGMQFQNPVFIVVMLFVITLFIAQIMGLYSISLPEKLEQKLLRRSGKNEWQPLLTGVLVVVMSTPCTAPYLGTTIGFALAGSTLDIFIILLAVALGLAIPYLLVCFMPDITAFIPKPGPWMNKLNAVMRIMLLLTMVWLFSILWAQTEAWTCIRLAVYLCLFLLLVWFRYLLLNQIAVSELEAEVKNGVVRLIGLGFVLLSVLIVVGSSWDVTHSFHRQREQEIQTKTRQIDFAEIAADVRAGKTVIVNVGADWCLTCTYNDKLVFGNIGVKNLLDRYNVKMINVDWTNYSAEILNFMSRYGRRGIPFYILFSPNIPEGMVLPEIMTEKDFREIIQNVAG